MKKRFVFVFLFLTVCILCNVNVHAKEEYDFIIGDKVLNSENNTITDGDDGKAIWNSKTKTLVLENFDYEGKGTYIENDFLDLDAESFYSLLGSRDPQDVKIILIGHNTFKYADNAFDNEQDYVALFCSYFMGDTSFEGTGSIDFITPNSNKVDAVIALYVEGDFDIENSKINFNIPKSNDESSVLYVLSEEEEKGIFSLNNATINMNIGGSNLVEGLYVSNQLNLNDSYIKITLSSGKYLYAINANEVDSSNSDIELDMGDATEDSLGIYSSNMDISNSIINIIMGSGDKYSKAIESEHSFDLKNSKLTIKTDTMGIVTDELSAEETLIDIEANKGVTSTGTIDFDFSTYNKQDYKVKLYENLTSEDFVEYTNQSNFANYKALKTEIPTNEGAFKYNLESNNIKALVNNISDFIILNEVDKFQMNHGTDIFISLNTSDEYSDDDAKLINDNLGNYTLGKIIDISLSKKTGEDGNNIRITDLTKKIKFSYNLDQTLIGNNRTFKVLRIHDGKLEILDASYDSKNNKLTFETDKFSTYAILYKDIDEEEVENPQTGDNIISHIIIGSLSLVGLSSCVLYSNKRKKFN